MVGKGGRFLEARIVDWDKIGGCFGGRSVALGASFYGDVYGLSCCACGVLGQTCMFCRFFKASGYVWMILWMKGFVGVWVLVAGYQECSLVVLAIL